MTVVGDLNGQRFEWDEQKAFINIQKHEVSFEEARLVFFDPRAVSWYDIPHSTYEDRFIIVGKSYDKDRCTVVHCYRDGGAIRIISARRSTKNELKYYEGGSWYES